MKSIFIVITLTTISSCTTRTSVYSNKQTPDHWVKVDNPKEFMKEDELKFFNKSISK